MLLMLVASLAEMISIGGVIPFLGALMAPDRLFHEQRLQPLIQWVGFSEPSELVVPVSVAFGIAAVIAGCMRLLLLRVSTRLSFAAGSDLSAAIYRRTLYQAYAVHAARNSSEVISGITTKASAVIYGGILPSLLLAGSGIMLAGILVLFLWIDPVVALSTIGGCGFIYLALVLKTRHRLAADSQRIARESDRVIKALQEGLGGIRDVIIDGAQPFFGRIYQQADVRLRQAQGNSVFISQAPRYAVEAIGILVIVLLALLANERPGGLASAIPMLGALALGAQRSLPVLQQAYGAWAALQSSYASLEDALVFLDQPAPTEDRSSSPEVLPFTEKIEFTQVAFSYNEGSLRVLDGLDLLIRKGSRVGIIGASGAGKSTVMDLLMGLLSPTLGRIAVDDVTLDASTSGKWQARLAHVPQSIFLSDSSVAENIAFAVPVDEIDMQRVRRAAREAQIADLIDSWPEGYATGVGERGVRLSGGQRQRIGIARALYKQADVIVFDEATSALDADTEAAVMESIQQLGSDLTVVVIAHRLTTLRFCDEIVEIGEGRVKRRGTYVQIVGAH